MNFLIISQPYKKKNRVQNIHLRTAMYFWSLNLNRRSELAHHARFFCENYSDSFWGRVVIAPNNISSNRYHFRILQPYLPLFTEVLVSNSVTYSFIYVLVKLCIIDCRFFKCQLWSSVTLVIPEKSWKASDPPNKIWKNHNRSSKF